MSGRSGGPVLAMVGSLGTTLEMWEPLLEQLGERCTVIRFDLRGHGGSPCPRGPYSISELAEDVLCTLDHLGQERVRFCGLSIGGMIGMWLGARAPERIERLALICTSANLQDAGYGRRAARVRSAGSVEVVADAVLERWFTPAWAAGHPEQTARFRSMLLSTAAEGYAACCEAIDGSDLRPALDEIRASTLVIAGAEDRATPPVHGQAIADAISGTRLELVADTAHLAAVQRPEPVARLVAELMGV